MELTQLLQFKAIAECSTMTEAAEELHISQPALSTTLKKLEDELGLRLFDRKRNKISLNEAGKLALSHVNVILKQVETMKTDLQEYVQKDHEFTVGFCDPGPLWYFVPKFSIAYPQIKIKTSLFKETIDTDNLLLNRTNDILISSKRICHPEIASVPFVKDQLLLSVPTHNALAKKTQICLAEKCPRELQSLTLFDAGGYFLENKQKPFWKRFAPTINLAFYDDYFMFSQMVRKTDALTISTKLVKHYRDDGPGRTLIPLTDPELTIQYYVSYLKKEKKRLHPFICWSEFCSKEIGET